MNNRTNSERLRHIVESFSTLRVGVIGDVMLDIFTRGSADRISPEAPVPIVLMESELEMPGGAGNVARGVSTLGAEVDLVGVRGDDRAGQALTSLLHSANVADYLITDAGRRTTVKHRVITQNEHLLRIDWETTTDVPSEVTRALIEQIAALTKDWDAIIIADYAKGVITEPFVQEVLRLAAEEGIIVTVDTKPSNFKYFKNVRLMSPNHKEAAIISGIEDVHSAGKHLVQASNSAVLITQGASGMTLFEGEDVLFEPAQAIEVIDVSGAGDTVSVAVTLALAAGATAAEALVIASSAAAIVVSQPGTTAVSTEELIEYL